MNEISFSTSVLFLALAIGIAAAYVLVRRWRIKVRREDAVREFDLFVRLGSIESATAIKNAVHHFQLICEVSESVKKVSGKLTKEWDFDGSPDADYRKNLRRVTRFLEKDIFTCVRSPSLGIEALFAAFLGAKLANLVESANRKAAEVHWSIAKEMSLSFFARTGKAWVEVSRPQWIQEVKGLPRKLLDWIAGKMDVQPGEKLDELADSTRHQIVEFEASLDLIEGLPHGFQSLDLEDTYEQLVERNFEPLWEGLECQPAGALIEVKMKGVARSAGGAADDAIARLFSGSADDLARALGDDVIGIADDALGAGDDIILSGADDAVGGLLTGALAKVPVLTILHSSWREANLLSKNHTDVETAVANLALDATGVGVGAWVGGTIGSVIPGWGTVVGAAIGGWLGKLGTDQIKRIDYQKAMEEYESLSRIASENQQKESARLFRSIKKVSAKYRPQRMLDMKNFPELIVWKPLMIKIVSGMVSEFSVQLGALTNDNSLRNARDLYLRRLEKDPISYRILGLSTDQERAAAVQARCSDLEKSLREVIRQLPNQATIEQQPLVALQWIGEVLSRVPAVDQAVRMSSLATILNSFAELQEASLLVWTRKTISTHFVAAVDTLLQGHRGAEKYEERVSPSVQAAISAGNNVETELKKLGKSKTRRKR